MTRHLPDPEAKPLISVDELVELLDGRMSRTSLHEAARRGELPVTTIGRRRWVLVGELRRQWGVDVDHNQSEPEAADGRPSLRSVG